jgi:hypothetical protein
MSSRMATCCWSRSGSWSLSPSRGPRRHLPAGRPISLGIIHRTTQQSGRDENDVTVSWSRAPLILRRGYCCRVCGELQVSTARGHAHTPPARVVTHTPYPAPTRKRRKKTDLLWRMRRAREHSRGARTVVHEALLRLDLVAGVLLEGEEGEGLETATGRRWRHFHAAMFCATRRICDGMRRGAGECLSHGESAMACAGGRGVTVAPSAMRGLDGVALRVELDDLAAVQGGSVRKGH